MLEKIQPHFHLVENARKAIRAAGLEPIETPVRGGTDGATLSYMGPVSYTHLAICHRRQKSSKVRASNGDWKFSIRS